MELTIHTKSIETPIGKMIACVAKDKLCLLEFSDRNELEDELKEITKQLGAQIIEDDNPCFALLEQQLKEYFSGLRKNFDIVLLPMGTNFQLSAWDKLQDIPYGKTVSYKKQAIAVGNLKAVRAVAKANGQNKIAILIPCHRVVGENGDLTGYAGGLWRKKFLLDLENQYSGKAQQKELF